MITTRTFLLLVCCVFASCKTLQPNTPHPLPEPATVFVLFQPAQTAISQVIDSCLTCNGLAWEFNIQCENLLHPPTQQMTIRFHNLSSANWQDLYNKLSHLPGILHVEKQNS